MSIFQKLFGKKKTTSNHPLLDKFLPHQPRETQISLKRTFDRLHDANIEVITWINPDEAISKRIMNQANSKSIAVWCNNDKKTAMLYGLGKVYRDDFENVMNWVRDITLVGKKAIVRIVKENSSDTYVEISR